MTPIEGTQLALGIAVNLTALVGGFAALIKWIVNPMLERKVVDAMTRVEEKVINAVEDRQQKVAKEMEALRAGERSCRIQVETLIQRVEERTVGDVKGLSEQIAEVRKDTRMLVQHLLGRGVSL